jgi:hypothetical protein
VIQITKLVRAVSHQNNFEAKAFCFSLSNLPLFFALVLCCLFGCLLGCCFDFASAIIRSMCLSSFLVGHIPRLTQCNHLLKGEIFEADGRTGGSHRVRFHRAGKSSVPVRPGADSMSMRSCLTLDRASRLGRRAG